MARLNHLALVLFCALSLLTPTQAFAGFWSDAYDYWSSGEMGEDMLNTVGLSGEDVVYAIDNPGEVWDAVKEDVSSGAAGERILGAVGLTPEDVAYVIDNPGEVADAVYQDWASGDMGERLLGAVGLTGADIAYIIDNPDEFKAALYDEWASGRAGDRLIKFGTGVYEGGKEVVVETAYMISDGAANLYIVTAYEDYQGVLDAYDHQSALANAYKHSDDPGETTRQLISAFAQLPAEFRDGMWNDPQKAGHILGSVLVPIAGPKAVGAATRAIPKVPGLRWTGTPVRFKPGTPCGVSNCPLVSDLQAVSAATEGAAVRTVSGAARPKVTPKATTPKATTPKPGTKPNTKPGVRNNPGDDLASTADDGAAQSGKPRKKSADADDGPSARPNVQARIDAAKKNPNLSGDDAALNKMFKEALDGDDGALGELEAIERWLKDGKKVEALPEAQNAGVKNPDYRVNGEIIEVKSRKVALNKRYIKDQIRKANKQIEESGTGETGALEIQLRGEGGKASLDAIQQQVNGQFTADRSTLLSRVSVYRDGQLAGSWIRQADGTITRALP